MYCLSYYLISPLRVRNILYSIFPVRSTELEILFIDMLKIYIIIHGTNYESQKMVGGRYIGREGTRLATELHF